MTTRRSPLASVAALLAAALLGVSLVGCMAATQAAPTAEPVPVPSPTSTPRPVIAAAIGDSIAIGNGVPAEDAWPLLVAQRFGWTLSDFGESAAGFTVPGLNTHTFDDQVSAAIRVHPDVVLVGATRNDLFAPTSTLKADATAALRRLRTALPDARIIGVSALWGSEPAPAQVAVISATVRDAVLDVGGSWVSLGQPFSGRDELVLADHVHPTVAGQRMLATTIANSIAAQTFPR
ncbi:SGNH/GDSL hydrolase family protein [Leifsonia shinshuensis]|uniref:SGNH/GDSL hydrolase family protein n=1 Tax=Leifsonia shinshuensis TaxID=150026 RepID=UPI00285B1B25|nr:SGNH/GDSL hydrolase family protein [Leifsonia shinshuensis]MDR6970236.1 lysophospholipase L1-like esterase [Leifsonia shinshuensis]